MHEWIATSSPFACHSRRRPAGGFAAAASELGMSPSAVSHAVRLVEERLGVPLFARTTRSVSLTEAGVALVGTVGPALQDIGERVERIRAVKGRVSGLLRLNVPSVALPIVTTPVVHAVAKRFPEVTVEIYVDDGIANIVADGFDAGIRLGEMIAQDMVTVRLTSAFKAVIVASPSYLSEHGRPKNIAELKHHNCIGYRLITSGGLYRWSCSTMDVTSSSKALAARSSTTHSTRVNSHLRAPGSPIFSSRSCGPTSRPDVSRKSYPDRRLRSPGSFSTTPGAPQWHPSSGLSSTPRKMFCEPENSSIDPGLRLAPCHSTHAGA